MQTDKCWLVDNKLDRLIDLDTVAAIRMFPPDEAEGQVKWGLAIIFGDGSRDLMWYDTEAEIHKVYTLIKCSRNRINLNDMS
jgi:hypothetical protein